MVEYGFSNNNFETPERKAVKLITHRRFMMTRNIFARGTRFLLEERSYEIIKELPEERFLCKDFYYHVEREFLYKDLLKYYNSSLLRFPARGKNADNASDDEMIREYDIQSITDLSEKEQELIFKKYEALKPLLTSQVKNKSKLIEEIEKSSDYSKSSIYKFYKDYLRSGGDLRSLARNYDKCGNPNQKRLSGMSESIIQEVLERQYLSGKIEKVTDVEASIIYRIDKWNEGQSPENHLAHPSESTIRRRMQEVDEYQRLKNRYGSKYAFKEMGYIERQIKPSRILQRVECDHTLLDIFVVDTDKRIPLGRPWLTLMLDIYSGYPLGMYIGFVPPSTESVMAALKHAILAKTDLKEQHPEVDNEWIAFGLPELLVVDNGKEFHGEAFKKTCSEMGIEVYYCPVQQPRYKGSIERYFKEINSSISNIPGATLKEMFKRNDFDPQKHAVISLSRLRTVINKWILDIYCEVKNTGVNGVPRELWEFSLASQLIQPSLPPSLEMLDVVLGKIEERALQKDGIRFNNLYFQSRQLGEFYRELRKKNKKPKVKFRYNPVDMGEIIIHDKFFERGYIKVPCLDQEYARGLPEHTHELIKDYSKEQFGNVDKSSLAKAKKELMDIVESEEEITKKTKRERNKHNRTKEYIDKQKENEDKKSEQNIKTSVAVLAEEYDYESHEWESFSLDEF